MRFRCAILEELGKPLVVDEVESQPLDVGQVLIKNHVSGICGKQLLEISGALGPDPYLSHSLGHESGSEVIEIGPGVRHVKPGDRVVGHWRVGVGIEAKPAKYRRGTGTVGVGPITTFSEHSVVSENRLTPISRHIPFEIAALAGCALTTGLGLVGNEMKPGLGESIMVFGAGGVGINVIQAAAAMSCYPIIAVDLYQKKLEMARQFGATHTVNAAVNKPADMVREWFGLSGIHNVVDTTGVPDVMQEAVQVAAKTGKVFFVAQTGHKNTLQLDPMQLHHGKRIIASQGGLTTPQFDIPNYLRLYQAGRLKLEQLITHRMPLERINDLLDIVRRGEACRAVIEMS